MRQLKVVKSFGNSDGVSRVMPGEEDYYISIKVSGIKMHEQK
jgi:hypothetical protein